jgi:hypothetical protein
MCFQLIYSNDVNTLQYLAKLNLILGQVMKRLENLLKQQRLFVNSHRIILVISKLIDGKLFHIAYYNEIAPQNTGGIFEYGGLQYF